jgi:hypothetical protein
VASAFGRLRPIGLLVALVVTAHLFGFVLASSARATEPRTPVTTSAVHEPRAISVEPATTAEPPNPTGTRLSTSESLVLLLVTVMLTLGGFMAVRPGRTSPPPASASSTPGRAQSRARRNHRRSRILS